MKLLVLADDLTGALDSGVQLAKVGISTLISYKNPFELYDKRSSEIRVLVVDTETRHINSSDAYKKVYDVAKLGKARNFSLYYKKSDSTLRGNIGSELAAIMDAADIPILFFAPAYPKLGRTTENGYQYVDGIPLENTAYAKDPLNPVKTGDIKKIIEEQTDIPVIIADKSNFIDIADKQTGKTIIVIDAKCDDDLEKIQEQLTERKNLLVSGSAGLSATLHNFIGKGVPGNSSLSPKKVLILSGSLNNNSLSQIKYASEKGIPLFTLEESQKQTDYSETENGKAFIDRIVDEFSQNDCLIVQTSDENLDLSSEKSYLNVAENVGQLIGEIINTASPDLVVVFGGDTLLGVVHALHDGALIPQCEILPGIVQSELLYDRKSLSIVSKAGGFGEPDTLVKILKHYKKL